MKSMNTSTVFLSSLAFICLYTSIQAQVLGVSFGSLGDSNCPSTGHPFGFVDPTQNAGVVPQLNFNNMDAGQPNAGGFAASPAGGITNLIYADGSPAKGVTLIFSGHQTWYTYLGDNNNQQLLGGVLDSVPEDGITLTVTGLSDGPHLLYLYNGCLALGNDFRGGTYAINGVPYVLAGDGLKSASSSTNFVVQKPGIYTPANGTAPAQFSGGLGNYFKIGFNGTKLTIVTSGDFGTDFPRASISGFQIITGKKTEPESKAP